MDVVKKFRKNSIRFLYKIVGRGWENIYIYIVNKWTRCFVCALISHGNDAIKSSKLKWNHEPQASSGFAILWSFNLRSGPPPFSYHKLLVFKTAEHKKYLADWFHTVTRKN